MQSVPFERAVIESYAARSAWDAAATDLVRTMLDRWHLIAGDAFVGGEAGAALRVVTREGSPAVLKVGFPHFEAVHEAVVLDAWCAQELAPEVLRQDPWTWSMLLDEVRPGTPLSQASSQDALDAGARLLGRLHRTPAPEGIPSLSETIEAYVGSARSVRADQIPLLDALEATDLLDRGVNEGERLAADSEGQALLHGDFNPGNVLAAPHGRWLAIDPKPMIGDPAFDLFPLVEQLGDLRGAPDRLTQAALLIDCDPARAIRWAYVRSALNISWYVTDGDREAGRTAAVEAAMWRDLSGL